MARDAGLHRTGLHVRARAQLQRNSLVPQDRRQPAQPRRTVRTDLDVVDDAHTMAETVGSAECDGLVDGRQPNASPA